MSSGNWKESTPSTMTVEPGDVWAVGEHTLACTDITDHGGAKLLDFLKVEPNLLFTDAPWSPSVHSAFRKEAQKAGQPAREGSWADLIGGFLEVANRTTGCAFIELSAVVPAATKQLERDATILDRLEINYGASNGWILRVHGPDHAHPWPSTWEHRQTMAEHDSMFKKIVANCSQPGDRCMDMCMGFGLMAEAAALNDRIALGTEISPLRMAGALTRLERLTNLTARKIGTI